MLTVSEAVIILEDTIKEFTGDSNISNQDDEFFEKLVANIPPDTEVKSKLGLTFNEKEVTDEVSISTELGTGSRSYLNMAIASQIGSIIDCLLLTRKSGLQLSLTMTPAFHVKHGEFISLVWFGQS